MQVKHVIMAILPTLIPISKEHSEKFVALCQQVCVLAKRNKEQLKTNQWNKTQHNQRSHTNKYRCTNCFQPTMNKTSSIFFFFCDFWQKKFHDFFLLFFFLTFVIEMKIRREFLHDHRNEHVHDRVHDHDHDHDHFHNHETPIYPKTILHTYLGYHKQWILNYNIFRRFFIWIYFYNIISWIMCMRTENEIEFYFLKCVFLFRKE